MQRVLHITVVIACLAALGCSGGRGRVRLDGTIRKEASAGAEAFAEGEVTEADQRYAEALRRSWQLDDALEIAHAAYNLAAVRAAERRYREAEDLLAEAEAEFIRAGESPRDVYLLEAKIARAVGDLATAEEFTSRAESDYCRSRGFHPGELSEGLAGRTSSHKEKHEEKEDRHERRRREQAAFEAQAHMLRAQLALDQGRIAEAESRLDYAEPWVRQARDDSILAEYEHARGALAASRSQFLAAAARFDAEAELLRAAKNYREISTAYEAAAVSYESVGRFADAAERFHRSARMWYGRGYPQQAMRPLGEAARLAEYAGRGDIDARVAILYSFVSADLATDRPSNPPPRPEEIPPASPDGVESARPRDSAPRPPIDVFLEESGPELVAP